MKRVEVRREDFVYLQGLLKEATGVLLDDGKEYLVVSRLGSLCYRREIDLAALIAEVRHDPDLRDEALDLLLNHETSFFRDWKPFEGLRAHVLPRLCAAAEARGDRVLRFWSCACSTGQEPYSLAMLCLDALGSAKWQVEITATDVSARAVERARQGSYNALEVNRGLPSHTLLEHFDKEGVRWTVKPHVKELVTFRQLNLNHPWPTLPAFDLILLRNVLIYFDWDDRRAIFTRLRQVVRPSTYLLLGSAELTMNLTDEFASERVDGALFFRRKEG
jgi:chemotaxis protein methyltransferase CheR